MIDTPHPNDVVFGRGPIPINHNRHTLWWKLIAINRDGYNNGNNGNNGQVGEAAKGDNKVANDNKGIAKDVAARNGNETNATTSGSESSDSKNSAESTSGSQRKIATSIISEVMRQSPPGRFLEACGNGKWVEVSGMGRIIEKTMRALRQREQSDTKQTPTKGTGKTKASRKGRKGRQTGTTRNVLETEVAITTEVVTKPNTTTTTAPGATAGGVTSATTGMTFTTKTTNTNANDSTNTKNSQKQMSRVCANQLCPDESKDGGISNGCETSRLISDGRYDLVQAVGETNRTNVGDALHVTEQLSQDLASTYLPNQDFDDINANVNVNTNTSTKELSTLSARQSINLPRETIEQGGENTNASTTDECDQDFWLDAISSCEEDRSVCSSSSSLSSTSCSYSRSVSASLSTSSSSSSSSGIWDSGKEFFSFCNDGTGDEYTSSEYDDAENQCTQNHKSPTATAKTKVTDPHSGNIKNINRFVTNDNRFSDVQTGDDSFKDVNEQKEDTKQDPTSTPALTTDCSFPTAFVTTDTPSERSTMNRNDHGGSGGGDDNELSKSSGSKLTLPTFPVTDHVANQRSRQNHRKHNETTERINFDPEGWVPTNITDPPAPRAGKFPLFTTPITTPPFGASDPIPTVPHRTNTDKENKDYGAVASIPEESQLGYADDDTYSIEAAALGIPFPDDNDNNNNNDGVFTSDDHFASIMEELAVGPFEPSDHKHGPNHESVRTHPFSMRQEERPGDESQLESLLSIPLLPGSPKRDAKRTGIRHPHYKKVKGVDHAATSLKQNGPTRAFTLIAPKDADGDKRAVTATNNMTTKCTARQSIESLESLLPPTKKTAIPGHGAAMPFGTFQRPNVPVGSLSTFSPPCSVFRTVTVQLPSETPGSINGEAKGARSATERSCVPRIADLKQADVRLCNMKRAPLCTDIDTTGRATKRQKTESFRTEAKRPPPFGTTAKGPPGSSVSVPPQRRTTYVRNPITAATLLRSNSVRDIRTGEAAARLFEKLTEGVDKLQEVYETMMRDNHQNDLTLQDISTGVSQANKMCESIRREHEELHEICTGQFKDQHELSSRLQSLEERAAIASIPHHEV